jgi:hypothetical protein
VFVIARQTTPGTRFRRRADRHVRVVVMLTSVMWFIQTGRLVFP